MVHGIRVFYQFISQLGRIYIKFFKRSIEETGIESDVNVEDGIPICGISTSHIFYK